MRRGRIYDTYIGDASRAGWATSAWCRRVRDVLIGLRPVFEWDRLYIGGGNGVASVEQRDLLTVGGQILVVPNSAGIVGGVKAWDLRGRAAAPADERVRPPQRAAGGRPGARPAPHHAQGPRPPLKGTDYRRRRRPTGGQST